MYFSNASFCDYQIMNTAFAKYYCSGIMNEHYAEI